VRGKATASARTTSKGNAPRHILSRLLSEITPSLRRARPPETRAPRLACRPASSHRRPKRLPGQSPKLRPQRPLIEAMIVIGGAQMSRPLQRSVNVLIQLPFPVGSIIN
jgi:hypothetical protein